MFAFDALLLLLLLLLLNIALRQVAEL